VGRRKALVLAPPEPPERPPWRTVVSLHRVDCVAAGSKGGIVIAGRIGGREVHITMPKDEVPALLAGSRWPLGASDPEKA
jgi:hypothetical protein